MKTFIASILVVTAFMATSCKHISFSHPKTLTELVTYTDQQSTTCKGKLKHEGEETVIAAYIQKLNSFPNESRFQIFESADIGSNRMDVKVNGNSKEVFDKILQQLSKLDLNDFVQIKVRGVITSQPLPMNGKCRMGEFLTISGPDYIKF